MNHKLYLEPKYSDCIGSGSGKHCHESREPIRGRQVTGTAVFPQLERDRLQSVVY